MPRLPDWPERLHACLAEAASTAFVWGETDCVHFCAGAVLAITGIDVRRGLKLRYKTAHGARRAIARRGGLRAAMCRVADAHGFTLIAPGFAQRGDVALILDDEGDATLGIVTPQGVATPHATRGLVLVPVARSIAAWAVGRA